MGQIETLIITAVWIWGFYAAFQDGMIFGFAGNFFLDKLPSWACKPLFSCPTCMASIHGGAWYWMLSNYHSFIGALTFIVCVAGINFIIKEQLYPEL